MVAISDGQALPPILRNAHISRQSRFDVRWPADVRLHAQPASGCVHRGHICASTSVRSARSRTGRLMVAACPPYRSKKGGPPKEPAG